MAAKPYGRLTRRAEFLRVAAANRKAPAGGVVLQAMAREDAEPVRLGFTVTKKVGNAVVRNRTKRRMRAAARELLLTRGAPGHDLVLIGRASTRSRRFADLVADIGRAMDRVGVAVRSP